VNGAYRLAFDAALALLGIGFGELMARCGKRAKQPRERAATMALLTRDQIIGESARDDRDFEDVPVPEWGGEVRLRSISGAQRDRYEASIIQQNGENRKVNLINARAKLIVLCATDENGRPLFSSEDVSDLGRKNAKAISRLFDAARKLAGMSEEDVEKLSENFGADPSDDGTSD
jgi:hypothetical protein